MAYTDPKTWSPGDVLTAADLNTYVRDNTTDKPRFSIIRTSGQTVNNNTNTAIIWDTALVDTDNFWDAAVSSGNAITIPFTGDYLLTYRLGFGAHADGGWRVGKVWKNGSSAVEYMYSQTQPDAASSPQAVTVTASGILTLAAGDTLQVIANQGSGVALNTAGSSSQHYTQWLGMFLG